MFQTRSNNQNPMSIISVPHVIKQTPQGMQGYDIFSRVLDDRIIMLCGEVNQDSAQIVVAQLLYLASMDPEQDITLYINSPGGSVSDGLSIFDTMNFIKPDVSTLCIGHAASMGAFLLAGGTKGKRFMLPNSEAMIHQPLGGFQGQASDMQIAMDHMSRIKETLTRYFAEFTGKDIDTLKADMDRDHWLTADEAVAYGIADRVITRFDD